MMRMGSISTGWLAGLGLVAVGLLAVSGPGAHAEDADARVDRGQELYQQHCAACHGVGAQGDGPVASVLDPKPADLTRIAHRRGDVFPDVEIQRIIDGRDPRAAHGRREMPVWGRRFRDSKEIGGAGDVAARGQIQLIVAYLKSLQVDGADE